MSSENKNKKMKTWHIFFGKANDGIAGTDNTNHPFLNKERTLTIKADRVFLDGNSNRAIAYKTIGEHSSSAKIAGDVPLQREEVIGVFSGVDHVVSEDCNIINPFTNLESSYDESKIASSTTWISEYRHNHGNGTKLYYVSVDGIPPEKIETFMEGFRKGITALPKEKS